MLVHTKKNILKIVFLITYSQSSFAQTKVEKYFEWFNKDHVIENPSFAHSDTEVVFSKILQEQCDANPGGIYQVDTSKSKQSQRYSDPVVTILNLKTQKTTSIDYGWTPSFSKNDSFILYVFQKVPLFQKRVLAQTMLGNNIKLYNRNTNEKEIIATPDQNFLLNPFFIDSINVAYNVGAAVNGAYGGGIGLNSVNIISKKVISIYNPKKAFGRPYEIGNVFQFNNSICFLVTVPVDKYSSSRYLLLNTEKTIHDFGVSDPKNMDSKIAIDKGNNLYYLDDDHDLIKDPNFIIKYFQNKQLFKKKISLEYEKASLSPDGKYLILYNYEGEVYLVNVETLEKVRFKLPDTEIHSITWSEDSKKFAIVQTHEEMCKTDKLLLYKIK